MAIRHKRGSGPPPDLVEGQLGTDADTGTLYVGRTGDVVTPVKGGWTVTAVKTGAYTAAWGELVRCDPSGGGFTVTLPSAVGRAGESVAVKNTTTSTNTITIDGDGSETIDGAANVTITTSRGRAVLVSDGSGWLVTG